MRYAIKHLDSPKLCIQHFCRSSFCSTILFPDILIPGNFIPKQFSNGNKIVRKQKCWLKISGIKLSGTKFRGTDIGGIVSYRHPTKTLRNIVYYLGKWQRKNTIIMTIKMMAILSSAFLLS